MIAFANTDCTAYKSCCQRNNHDLEWDKKQICCILSLCTNKQQEVHIQNHTLILILRADVDITDQRQ